MKGAMAELCAKAITTPRNKRVTSKGTSHRLLPLQKNESNSPIVLKRAAAVRAAFPAPMIEVPDVYYDCD